MSRIKKRLMILGAGINQLPAIRKAVDRGFFVISVDYLPDNIGHRYSHQSVNCSTVDAKRILKAARDLNVDGIITLASDVATPTVGFVAEELGLPGGSSLIVQTLSNKARFRQFQRKNGLNCPNFLIGERFEDVERKISSLNLPLMFKPVDTSGSRGITRIDQINHESCFKIFEYVQSYSRSKTVCVEEFLKGVEVGGDAFLLNGKIAFMAITHKHMKAYVVIGHSLPTNISKEDQKKVCTEIENTCKAVGYVDGPLNFDVMVCPEYATIIEMSPRLGGNGIPMIIERATGADLIAATIYHALRLNVEFKGNYEKLNRCGSWIFGSNQSGILERIATQEDMVKAMPEIFEYVSSYNIGDEVPKFIHNGNSIGYILFDCPMQASYDEIIKRLECKMQLQVV